MTVEGAQLTTKGGAETGLGLVAAPETGGLSLALTGEGASQAALGAVLVSGAAKNAQALINTPIESRRVGDYTSGIKKAIDARNAEANGGSNACDRCGKALEKVGNEKGVPTPDNQLQRHHKQPLSECGPSTVDNTEVLCPQCHKRGTSELGKLMPEPVEVWFKIDKDSQGFPESQEWEQLYSWPVDEGFRVDNVPFFVKEVAVGDVISAHKTEAGWYRFDRVVRPGDHSTFRIWLNKSLEARADQIRTELVGLGSQAELTLGRLIAVDAKSEVEPHVWQYLVDGRERGDWDLQVGCSRD